MFTHTLSVRFIFKINRIITYFKGDIMERPPAKLLDRVRYLIRLKGYSIRTEQSYVDWVRRFILFHNKRHPQNMGKDEIEAYLTHLAVNRHVAPSTPNQAFNALLFLYRNVLEIEFPENINAYRSKTNRKNKNPHISRWEAGALFRISHVSPSLKD